MKKHAGILVDTGLTKADSLVEQVAALPMIEPHADRARPITLGGDKSFDTVDFVKELSSMTRPRMWRRTKQ